MDPGLGPDPCPGVDRSRFLLLLDPSSRSYGPGVIIFILVPGETMTVGMMIRADSRAFWFKKSRTGSRSGSQSRSRSGIRSRIWSLSRSRSGFYQDFSQTRTPSF